MLRKRGLGKMRLQCKKTRLRRTEITRIVKIIETLELSQELERLEQILLDLGTANTSEETLDALPQDYHFLNDLFTEF